MAESTHKAFQRVYDEMLTKEDAAMFLTKEDAKQLIAEMEERQDTKVRVYLEEQKENLEAAHQIDMDIVAGEDPSPVAKTLPRRIKDRLEMGK